MIAIPDFSAGAMENWGLITYRETALLFKDGVSSASNKQRIAIVVSHEVDKQEVGEFLENFKNHVEMTALGKSQAYDAPTGGLNDSQRENAVELYKPF